MTAAITDMTQYSALRLGAKNDDPAALRDVAGQFEALFLQTMLKSMRDASIGDPLFGESNAHDTYESMLDQQLAVEMASGRGIGLAEMLVRQLGGAEAALRPPERGYGIERRAPGSGVGSDDLRQSRNGSGPFATATATAASASANDRGSNHRAVTGGSTAAARGGSVPWHDALSFARAVWPHAERVGRELNVPAEGVLAQAALETGWGRHVMPGPDGSPSMNLFGIKAGATWSGQSVAHRTLEFDGNTARPEVARFRSYSAIAESFDDYATLIASNERYAAVLGQGENVEGFAAALADSGYATDPEYARKIARVASSDTMSRVLADLKPGEVEPIQR